MNIILKYSEIERMILANRGQEITISYVEKKIIRCVYKEALSPFINVIRKTHIVDAEILLRERITFHEHNTFKIRMNAEIVFVLESQLPRQIDRSKRCIFASGDGFEIDMPRIYVAGKEFEYSIIDITAEESGLNIEALLYL